MEQKYLDLHTDQIGFISDVLNQTKPALVVFYNKDNWEDSVMPHLRIVESFKEKVPQLPVFLFDISEEKNGDLTEAFGIEQSPTFVIFKNGNMNRFLEEGRKTKLNDKSIVKFLGSPALYGVGQDEAKKISAFFSTKANKAAKKAVAALKNDGDTTTPAKPVAKKGKGTLAQAVAAQKEKNKNLKITKSVKVSKEDKAVSKAPAKKVAKKKM